MSIQTADTAVRTSIVVEAPVERAFDVFTQQMPSWWHPDHHILRGELAEMVFEPRVGGHIYDRGVDGSECRWARVLAYEPPSRVVFSWDIDLEWKIETDRDKTSEVEVRFRAEGPERTRWSSNTATSIVTAPAGSACAMPWARPAAGGPACSASLRRCDEVRPALRAGR